MGKQSILLAMAVLLAAYGWASAYSGGTGEPNDPYLIATAEDLNDIGNHTEDFNKCFLMVADINLANYTGTQFNIIGNDITKFTGVFDGNDHKIWNFTWDSNGVSYIGLFGYVAGTGQIKNLGLESVNVNTTSVYGEYVAGLVGFNSGTITNCYTTGAISGGDYFIGGLAGGNGGTITNCYAASSVSGVEYCVGGLVGGNYSTISKCYATGGVDGYMAIGGLVGFNFTGVAIIEDCCATGAVSGNSDTGGLVGCNGFGTISNCYATGDVDGNDDGIGGLAGRNDSGTISNCYATGVVDGNNWIGGLVGINNSISMGNDTELATITNCYSTSSVSGLNDVGGLAGYNNKGTISNCYAAGAVDGNDYTGGLVGWNSEGTISNCYATGAVGGNDYTGGLVGWNYEGTISNSHATGTISGHWDIGGLVGDNYDSTISNCYAAGSVTGNEGVGGLTGDNCYGAISNCYATGSVTGNNGVGGLVSGTWNGTISNCYATGAVDGNDYIGGLVGWHYEGTISNCYATGAVDGNDYTGGLVGDDYGTGTVLASFWDIETGGPDNGIGTPKTTAEMKTRSTFINAGWDFVCETVNGTDEVWTIKDGVDYPRLVWECFKDYQDWLDVNKPPCWLCPRQCHGDTDNQKEGSTKTGYYYVHFKDLGLLLSAWNIKEPGREGVHSCDSGIAWPDPNICADFAHDKEGSAKTGYYRVHYNDLAILLVSWNIKEPPHGPGIEPNCLDCP